MLILLIALGIGVVVLGYLNLLLRSSNKNLKNYTLTVQDLVIELDEIRRRDAEFRDELTVERDEIAWERDAAHMMLETVLELVPDEVMEKPKPAITNYSSPQVENYPQMVPPQRTSPEPYLGQGNAHYKDDS